MMKNRKVSATGFSLLELLVVLGIAGLLAGGAMSAAVGLSQWQGMIRSRSIMNELELAVRLYRNDSGQWPDQLSRGEVAVNGNSLFILKELEPYLESLDPEKPVEDGFGNQKIYLLVDQEGDNWILGSDFRALPESARPERIRQRIGIYSLDEDGRLAASNW
jgi:prepilin-type N-terminal cleavage/methylation domain-containing protein